MCKNKNTSDETRLKKILPKQHVPDTTTTSVRLSSESPTPKKKKVGKNNKYMYGMFHEHFNPYCETSIPIYDLSIRAHLIRNSTMFWNETTRRYQHKMLLRAIPGMSTVLGGDQWSYSEYSPKEVTDIYLYFLSVFLQKHPVDYKIKKYNAKTVG